MADNIISVAVEVTGNATESLNAMTVAVGNLASEIIKNLAGAFKDAATAALDWAGTLDDMGDVLGTTAEENAALAVAVESVGGNAEAFTNQLAFMARGLTNAKGELGPTGTALQNLGIAFTDANGQMLDTPTIVQNVADKLAEMPDGLEKTDAMMSIFGKSGKDLSDVMSSLADGGLAAADEKAKALGLTMSEDMVAAGVNVSRQLSTMKLAVQGLFVSIGAQLLPVIQPLLDQLIAWAFSVMPYIQEAIASLTPYLESFTTWLGVQIPLAMQFLSDFWTGTLQPILAVLISWFQMVIPVAIQFLSDRWNELVLAMTTAWTSILQPALTQLFTWFQTSIPTIAAFWTDTLQPALGAVWNFILNSLIPTLAQLLAWVAVNIPPAIQTLSDFWQNVLYPAILAVWQWMNESLFPTLQVLFDWISTNLPPAMQALSDFWTNTLQPAMQGVWQWMNDSLFPTISTLFDWLSKNIPPAIQALSDLWTKTLQPAMKGVYDFITQSLLPIFGDVVDFIGDTFTTVVNSLKSAFDGIATAVSTVIDFVQDLIDKFNSITIPDWMVPGSPTPFEMGLRGIASAMADLNRTALPQFTANLQAIGASGVPQNTTNQSNTNNWNLTINGNGRPNQNMNLLRAVARA